MIVVSLDRSGSFWGRWPSRRRLRGLPLIAFHLKRLSVFSDTGIPPLLYALAMAVDAVAALVLGRLFDRRGFPVLIAIPVLSFAFAPLAFTGSAAPAVAGIVLWGIGMGAPESIVRAVVATMIPVERPGTAYGVFNFVQGAAWFAGSALMGVLYDVSLTALVTFSVGAQLLAVPVLLGVRATGTLTPPDARG